MVTGIGWPRWIGVVAEDLERQRRFYRDVMGFREIDAAPDYVHFDLGQGRLFEILRKDPETPEYAERRYQLGFEVDDIEAVREQLVRGGVQPISDIEGGPDSVNSWAYFRDPEGNVFEITQWHR
jgi:catechol 2,3-dioxygenase-like lactoylglutathione lyase family enzyme